MHANSPQASLGRADVLPQSFAQAVHPTSVGNPGTLGLFAFASTTLILSLYNLQARGIQTPNVVLGMAIFCGGLAQLLAGMWEFPRGNVFGGTAFTLYGSFWMSYATILLPFTGVAAAYDDPNEFKSALGIYLTTWAIITFLLCIVTLRKNVAFVILFALLTITFIFLAAGDFAHSVSATKGGGGLGVITACVAFYIGLSELLASEDMAIVHLPLGIFSKKVESLTS
ncbi:FUN34 transmembrane protein [Panaeolus papilionaceus]|nr:FUN34 transmembrane protein [Panaeolus papilionaceus]